LIDMGLANGVDAKIGLSPKDQRDISLEAVPGQGGVNYKWNQIAMDKIEEKTGEVEVDFTKNEVDLLKRRVKFFDDKKAIPFIWFELCAKIASYNPKLEKKK